MYLFVYNYVELIYKTISQIPTKNLVLNLLKKLFFLNCFLLNLSLINKKAMKYDIEWDVHFSNLLTLWQMKKNNRSKIAFPHWIKRSLAWAEVKKSFFPQMFREFSIKNFILVYVLTAWYFYIESDISLLFDFDMTIWTSELKVITMGTMTRIKKQKKPLREIDSGENRRLIDCLWDVTDIKAIRLQAIVQPFLFPLDRILWLWWKYVEIH